MLHRAVLSLVLACLLTLPARATWSIVVVNRRTGEVAVASATCIARINLLRGLPAVVVGRGAGVIQASGDSGDLVSLAEGLRQGLSPEEILALVQAVEPSVRQLQTGIVSLYPGAPVTFTGSAVGRAKFGVVGEVGDLAYSIQGNVITGQEVVEAARDALLATPGDTGQKLLAAMQAARALGGDGRCSCSFGQPDSCGAPPPSFTKSAHCGFLVVARMGDPEAPCLTGGDCASGGYYLRLNIRGADATESSPDPVDQLTERYLVWRAERSGRPDGLLSTVSAPASLPADGNTKRRVTIRLVDLDGVPLTHGGADVRVSAADGARSNLALGSVSDHGDGSYSFTLGAGTRIGLDRLVITAADDLVEATLYPYLEVRSDPPAALHAGQDALSASAGGSVPFVLHLPGLAGAPYLLLTSAAGTEPGLPVPGGALLPLVPDPWFAFSLRHAGEAGLLTGTQGVLDAGGRAEATFTAPPAALLPLIGRGLYWAAVAGSGASSAATNPVELAVGP